MAVHEPTGERLETTSDRTGRFGFLNVRVGGPYTVTATLSAFADHVDQNVFVALGEDRTLRVEMALAELNTTVEVTPQTTLNPTRAGTAANVSPDTVATVPTIQRSLTDIARTSPYFNALSTNGADAALSVAGRNRFFNTIQVDGAPFNDLSTSASRSFQMTCRSAGAVQRALGMWRAPWSAEVLYEESG